MKTILCYKSATVPLPHFRSSKWGRPGGGQRVMLGEKNVDVSSLPGEWAELIKSQT